MLENLLNVIWFLVAVTGVCLWVRWWSPRYAGNEARLSRGWIALMVLIILLLPVISMTDDLHPGPAYMEDSSASKRRAPAMRPAAAHRVPANAQSAPVASLPSNPKFDVALFVSANLVVERSFGASALYVTVSGRSPPAIPS